MKLKVINSGMKKKPTPNNVVTKNNSPALRVAFANLSIVPLLGRFFPSARSLFIQLHSPGFVKDEKQKRDLRERN